MAQVFRCKFSTFLRAHFLYSNSARFFLTSFITLKVSHRENALTNKTHALMESTNMDIWVISTLNQLFIRGSYNEIKFSKK